MPVPPVGRGQLLVRVRAAALNPKDSFVRKGRFRVVSGRSFPKYVGADLAGEVIERGPGASDLAVGTRVFGMIQEWTYRRGTLAEYVVVEASEVGPIPEGLSFEQAAALPLVSLTALQALRDVAKLRAGDSLCIHGASGGVGSAAIQIAAALGATITTTSSGENRELCLALGATEALDYRTDAPFSSARSYRIVLDAFGNQSLDRVRGALTKDGVYVTTVPSGRIVRDTLRTLVSGRRARLVVVKPRRADLAVIAALVEQKKLRPVVDRALGWNDAVEGMRHLETKHARGKIVVTIAR
jgi:NADPH:quinone reductase-like Zn-dependent oxidoreductase